jgi:hypothetical protein
MFAPIRLRDLEIFFTVTGFGKTEVLLYLNNIFLLFITNVRDVTPRSFKIRIHVFSGLILSPTITIIPYIIFIINIINTIICDIKAENNILQFKRWVYGLLDSTGTLISNNLNTGEVHEA